MVLPTPAETFYLYVYSGSWGSFHSAQHAEVWRETNGLAGLQRGEPYCTDGTRLERDFFHTEVIVPDPRSPICC